VNNRTYRNLTSDLFTNVRSRQNEIVIEQNYEITNCVRSIMINFIHCLIIYLIFVKKKDYIVNCEWFFGVYLSVSQIVIDLCFVGRKTAIQPKVLLIDI